MATVTSLLSENDNTIRNKNAFNRIDNVEDADLRANIINNLQSDLNITDPDDARYVKNKNSIQGIIKFQTFTLNPWAFGNSYDINISPNFTFLFEKIYGIITEQVVFSGVTYNIGDRIGINYSNEAGNGDLGGVQTRITNTTFNILPKNFVLSDIVGGFQTISSNTGTGKIIIIIEFYGTPI